MSTPFDGQWTDGNGDTITITSQDAVLSAKYSNGRGPFTGVSVTVGSPVAYINFTDDAAFTGVLTTDGNSILWSNQTTWKK
jgi:hypothetical protein